MNNNILIKTYTLTALTILFTAFTSYLSIDLNYHINTLTFILGSFGLLFLTLFTSETFFGIISIFIYTGFMGLGLGPFLEEVLKISDGKDMILLSTFLTSSIFFLLSGYVHITKKDFSSLGSFLLISLIVLLLTSILQIFLHLPLLTLILAVVGVFIFSGYILYDTSRLVNGGETDCVLITLSLYLDILNLFLNILQILIELKE
jgi:modulator of FtsH protease